MPPDENSSTLSRRIISVEQILPERLLAPGLEELGSWGGGRILAATDEAARALAVVSPGLTLLSFSADRWQAAVRELSPEELGEVAATRARRWRGRGVSQTLAHLMRHQRQSLALAARQIGTSPAGARRPLERHFDQGVIALSKLMGGENYGGFAVPEILQILEEEESRLLEEYALLGEDLQRAGNAEAARLVSQARSTRQLYLRRRHQLCVRLYGVEETSIPLHVEIPRAMVVTPGQPGLTEALELHQLPSRPWRDGLVGCFSQSQIAELEARGRTVQVVWLSTDQLHLAMWELTPAQWDRDLAARVKGAKGQWTIEELMGHLNHLQMRAIMIKDAADSEMARETQRPDQKLDLAAQRSQERELLRDMLACCPAWAGDLVFPSDPPQLLEHERRGGEDADLGLALLRGRGEQDLALLEWTAAHKRSAAEQLAGAASQTPPQTTGSQNEP